MNTVSRFDTIFSAALFSQRSSPTKADSTSVQVDKPTRPSAPRLSSLPPVPRPRYDKSRRRAKPTTSSVKLPPPSTPFLLRIVLAFWSILLSFWTSLVGETRASRVSRRKRVKASSGKALLRTLKEGSGIGGLSSDDGEGSGSDGEVASDDDGLDISPVTQNNDTTPVDQPDDSEFITAAPKPHRESFSFRLRSAEASALRDTVPAVPPPQGYTKTQPPPSILSNPIKRTNRLLPNPMSTSVLDPSIPATAVASTIAPHPRLHQTPFHHQKTLILDLDETLIHSTSRPMSYAASAGGGLLGLSFGGLLGGRRSRREGHTVEVVLNGRSTTYHVYKRPYVDHFLKKVSLAPFASLTARLPRGTLSSYTLPPCLNTRIPS
jgi:CTD nuclear envelope phosphatase 1